MRKVIILLILIVFLSVTIFLVLGIIKKSDGKILAEKRISSFPSFSFIELDDSIFSSDSIKEGPVLIVRFHPECDHCLYEISEILKSKIPESGTKILLISGADRNSVSEFLSCFDIDLNNSIITLIDGSYVFDDIFGKDIVPSNYIYNKELQLVKALYGEYRIETIEKYLGIDE